MGLQGALGSHAPPGYLGDCGMHDLLFYFGVYGITAVAQTTPGERSKDRRHDAVGMQYTTSSLGRYNAVKEKTPALSHSRSGSEHIPST